MKNIFVYYSLILAPPILLMIFWTTLSSTLAIMLLLTYILVYRTVIDGYKLYDKGLMRKNDIWKLILPGTRGKYLRELYLTK